jgi:hypothetical protein
MTSRLGTSVLAAGLGAVLAIGGAQLVHAAAPSKSDFQACADKQTGALFEAPSGGACLKGQTAVTWFGHLDPTIATQIGNQVSSRRKALAGIDSGLKSLKARLRSKQHAYDVAKKKFFSDQTLKARELDELEMTETESLRLQMAMDRVSKFMTALSNIEKEAADTDSAEISNSK